jgi:hypothetical protein
MGRRIEVELTSAREDGSWTWRAAGAKQPKGDVAATLLYDGAKVGDVVKVEAEFHLDGIEVVEVFAPKAKKERTDLLELKSRPLRDDELVTTQRVARSERRGDGEGRGRGRGRRGDGEGRGDRRDRGDRGERRGGSGQRQKPEADRRPRPKRLRPRRVHRDALLAEITEEHRPIVEQVMKDGMPGVRAAIDKQNAEAKEAGKPEIDASPILSIAEKNLAKARLAEWRDRADAALADAAELDIRDLRSVVVAGSDVARDDESRALAEQIKTVLDQRLESDHAAWLADLDSAVSEGRVVRGLRLSSRPVKAGAPLPTETASKLAQQAADALAPDVMQDRWATVLDALAFSPVRGAVTPVGLPAEPGEELLAEVRRLSDRIPAIAALFGIDPAQVPKSAKRRRPPRKDSNAKGRGKGGDTRGGGGGRRNDERPKPKDPSATKPGARPVPGAEKPAEPDPEPTVDETPETDAAVDSAPVAEEQVDAPAPETSDTEPEAPAADAEAPAAEVTEPEPAAEETPAAEPEAEATEANEPEAPAAEAEAEAIEGSEPEAPADEAEAKADGEPDESQASGDATSGDDEPSEVGAGAE